MRLVLLTAFTMVAFASNSILTRMAIEPGYIDPFGFALVRVFAGALFLCGMVLLNRRKLPFRGRGRMLGAASLSIYMVGFSVAYVSLDAGIGALILFGVVQISMFSYSAWVGERPKPRQLLGAGIAFAGLLVALWPEPGAEHAITGAFSMILAGLGWAAYTLSGKNARDPLAETGANFVICLPVLLVTTGLFVGPASWEGVLLAVLCGSVTSGMGYALWYTVLPDLQRNSAAVVQLSVPIIAIAAGALMLGERVTPAAVLAALLVILGIAMAVTRRPAPTDRS